MGRSLLFCHESILSSSPLCSSFSRESPSVSSNFQSICSGLMAVAFFCWGRKSPKRTWAVSSCCLFSGISRFWSASFKFFTPCSTLLASTLYKPKRFGSLNCLRKFVIKFFKSPSLLLNLRKLLCCASSAGAVLSFPFSSMSETTESLPTSASFLTSVRSSKTST